MLIIAMAILAVILVVVLAFIAWLVIDAICARVLRFPRWY